MVRTLDQRPVRCSQFREFLYMYINYFLFSSLWYMIWAYKFQFSTSLQFTLCVVIHNNLLMSFITFVQIFLCSLYTYRYELLKKYDSLYSYLDLWTSPSNNSLVEEIVFQFMAVHCIAIIYMHSGMYAPYTPAHPWKPKPLWLYTDVFITRS